MDMPSVGPSRFDKEPPKYATYEVSHKGGDDDTLPSMPTPEGESKKEFVEEGVELGPMSRGAAAGMGLQAGFNGSSAPVSPPRSPVGGFYAGASNYNHNGGQDFGQGGYGSRGFSRGGAPTGNPTLPVLTSPSGYVMGPGRTQSPRPLHNDNGWDQARRSPMPSRQATYDVAPHQEVYDAAQVRSATYDHSGLPRQGSFDSFGSTPGGNGYGMGPRRPPRPTGGGGGHTSAGMPMNSRSPAPQQSDRGGYPDGRFHGPAPTRQYSTESTHPLMTPTPLRQDTDAEVEAAPGSPGNLMNNSGFDFNSGYSRPGTANGHSGSSQMEQGLPQGGTYPGMRAYQPASSRQQGWGGV